MIDSSLWTLATETMQSFCPHYQMAMRAVVKDVGLQHNWFPMYVARGLHPQPITPQHLMNIRPYYTLQQQHVVLNELVASGYLSPKDNGFMLTPKGSKAIERVFRIIHRELGKIKGLPYQQMKRLAELLRHAVYHALHAPQPVEKHALMCSRWTDMGDYSPAAIAIEQYLTDLSRFRLDCHRSVWQQTEVSGTAWEIFTMIWNGTANNLQLMRKILQHRHHTLETFSQSLQELIRLGWIAEVDGKAGQYKVTPEGDVLRNEAEDATNALFFPAWSRVGEFELAETFGLLAELKDTLSTNTRGNQAVRRA